MPQIVNNARNQSQKNFIFCEYLFEKRWGVEKIIENLEDIECMGEIVVWHIIVMKQALV